jgi:hypothetical protein
LNGLEIEGIEETCTLDVLGDLVGPRIGGSDIAERSGLDECKERKDSES